MAYKNLAVAYERLGNYKDALRFQSLWRSTEDSLKTIELQTSMAELERKYEYEKQAKQVLQLEQKTERQTRETAVWILIAAGIGITAVITVTFLYLISQRRKAVAKQKTIELEHRALRTQMNPHFIFNSLNSIQQFFIEKDFIKANDYLGDFGQLMRRILDNSAHSFISLEEELDTLELYLKVEKLRLGEKLNYRIKCDPELDTRDLLVPPLILQPYVENAIWHGIIPAKNNGTVTVNVRELSSKTLLCEIIDNGIGYFTSLTSKPNSTHQSKGISITEERLGKQGRVAIDEVDKSAPKLKGTKVIIEIPIRYDQDSSY